MNEKRKTAPGAVNPGELLQLAGEARRRAYAPYSHFSVGAALLCADGSVFTGCNIENISFSPTCCAERVAFFRAIEAGQRDFRAIAIVGASAGESGETPCFPCGVCRQVMAEFCRGDFEIYLSAGDGKVRTLLLSGLLPYGFSPDSLRSDNWEREEKHHGEKA